jgi:ComF family protein
VPALEHVAPLTGPEAAGRGLRPWLTAALDLLFPPFCPVCRSALGPGRRDPLCGACWQALERIAPPWCRRCGEPLSIEGLCGQCRRHRRSFVYARAALRYGPVAREALHAFKFDGRRALAVPLADVLAGLGLSALPGAAPDLLIPVPLHPRRERERGYNQSALLARRLGYAWGVAVAPGALVRAVATAPQSELDAAARRRNVRRAFVVRRPDLVIGRHVLLVDDIFTTGATVGECARALNRAGAAAVGVLTVARVT